MNHAAQKMAFSIAESDYYFKEILIKTLLSNPFYSIVKNCNNGHELIQQLYMRQETCFIIDVYMPILSGLEAIRFIRQSGNVSPFIAYSATYQHDVHAALQAMPDVFYCQKKVTVVHDLLKSLGQPAAYQAYLSEWQQQPLVMQAYMERQRKGWYTPSLTEIQVMKLCYEGLSNKEIGQYLNLSVRTIDAQISKLTQKLGLRNKIDLIRFCVEQGYYNSGI